MLKNQLSIESLLDADEFLLDKIYWVVFNASNIQNSDATGSKWFLGKLLLPKKENLIISSKIIDFLVEFYKVTYESINFRKLFIETQDNSDFFILLNQAY